MLTIEAKRSTLLLIDFQTRLMPVIDQADAIIANARRLLDAAKILNIHTLFTEQNSKGLGPTVPELSSAAIDPAQKITFDAIRAEGFLNRIANDHGIVVAGCEAHVCVLQTVLGLLAAKRKVYVVRDALGSRRSENKEAAVRRMELHGGEIVTTEMVLFEWLESMAHPYFRKILALIKQ